MSASPAGSAAVSVALSVLRCVDEAVDALECATAEPERDRLALLARHLRSTAVGFAYGLPLEPGDLDAFESALARLDDRFLRSDVWPTAPVR